VIKTYEFQSWRIDDAPMSGLFPEPKQEFRCYVVRYVRLAKWQWINDRRLMWRAKHGKVVGAMLDYQGRFNQMP
jgi:hypothetical protein